MNIIPELNINKHPSVIKNGSIIDACNIIVSDDGILQTEPGIIAHIEINEFLEKEFIKTEESDYKIINVIPCNTELVIFVLYNNRCYICRYNEITKEIYNTGFEIEYSGGKFTNTFTYNQNQLIIAFGEYFEDNSNLTVPFKVINLLKFKETYNNENIKSYHKDAAVPEVYIPKITTNYIKGNAYKGWYYIFIRFKLAENNYTQWYDTNTALLVDNYSIENIITAYEGQTKYLSLNQKVSDNLDFCNISFKCKVSHYSDIINNINFYDYYQLGFVNVIKDSTKAFRSNDLSISEDTEFIYDQNTIISASVDNLIKSYFNYYNVKAAINYNNQLFIANFSEPDITNEKLMPIISGGLYNKGEKIGSQYKTNKKDYYIIVTNATNSSEYFSNTDDIIVPNENNIVELETEKDKYGYYVDLYKYLFDSTKSSLAAGYICVKLVNNPNKDRPYLLKKYSTGGYVTRTPYSDDYTAFRYYPFETVINFYFNDVNTYDFVSGIEIPDNYEAAAGGMIRLFRTDGTIEEYTLIKYNHGVNGNPLVKSLYKTNFSLQVKESDEIITDDTYFTLESNGCMPKQDCNYFIHFIDKYGQITKGFNINNFNIIDKQSLNESITIGGGMKIENGVITTTLPMDASTPNAFKEAGYKIIKYLNIHDYKFNDYIGFFFSYESFEDNRQFKGFTKLITNTDFVPEEVYNLHIFNDALNYKDKIKLGFDKYNDSKETIEESANSVHYFTADTLGNILFSTNIALNLNNKGSIEDGKYFTFYNTNVYQNKYKTLIPCSNIYYYPDINNVTINTKNSFLTTDFAIMMNGIYYDSAIIRYRKQGDATNLKDTINNYIYKLEQTEFEEIPTEFLQINNKPIIQFTPTAGTITEDPYEKAYMPMNILEVKNTVDLFKEKHLTYCTGYPKTLDNYVEDVTFVTDFPKTIRRSNIIADESKHIGWRFFNNENYKMITENKGDIIKLVSIGNIIIVHTQMSMFVFDATNTLEGKDTTKLQLGNTDIWDINYKEVLTSSLGYGGLEKPEHSILGEFGYIFYDRIGGFIYRYDEGHLVDIGADIKNVLVKIKDYDLNLIEDEDRNRILFKFFKEDNVIILSYNYKFNKFISRHNYNYDSGYSTKDNLYILNKDCKQFYTFDNNQFNTYNINNGDNIHGSSIDIIFNTEYEKMKFIEYIKYKIYKIEPKDVNVIFPVEGHTNYYAGKTLRVYSEFCDTDNIDISDITANNSMNSVNQWDKPYWRMGNFHFNALRDKLNQSIIADNKSQIYGNWFVVHFDFDSVEQIEIESIDCKFRLDTI